MSHRRSPKSTVQRKVGVDLSRQSAVSQQISKEYSADIQVKRDNVRQVAERAAKRQDGIRRDAQAEPERQRGESQELIDEGQQRQREDLQQSWTERQRNDLQQSWTERQRVSAARQGSSERQRDYRVNVARQEAAERRQPDSSHYRINSDSKRKSSDCQLETNMEQCKRAHVDTVEPAQEVQRLGQNVATTSVLEDQDEVLSHEEHLEDISEDEEEKPPQHSVDFKKLMLVFLELFPDNFAPVTPRSPPSEFTLVGQ
ncbi:uncharacterized protein [Palaemon carinicauda]|uniref:uncharacterized protein n=1 Tax=Palaemon carinicauda TaxID=392227 RepID=UPI0035B5C8F4